jgi:glycosyltransferase involved in cell wall biosynthesis
VGLSAALANSKKVFSLYSCSNALPAFEYPLSLRYALRLAKSYKPLKLKSIDEIIVSSWKAYNDLIKAGFTPKNLHHISVGIDTNRFKPKRIDETRIRNYLKIPKEAKVILFAGDLAPYKGVEIFLYSLKKLRNRSMNIVGLILTKGLYERELQRRRLIENIVKQLDIRDNIRLLGVRNDIDVIYNLSDVVVFPFLRGYSLMDVPRALLEAMACGRPVVATKVGAIPEVIRHGENGILIEPNNELALEEAIVLLLQNEGEAERLGKNASRCIVEKHELNKIIDKLEHVYKNS